MNKIAHGLVLVFFSIACWFLWALLTMTARLMPHLLDSGYLPGFTRFCLELRPALYVLPLLALVWCVIVWFRKAESRDSWVRFFALSTSLVIFATFPTLVAIYLPLVAAFEHMASK